MSPFCDKCGRHKWTEYENGVRRLVCKCNDAQTPPTAVGTVAAAVNLYDLDRRLINAMSAAVGDSAGDDAALGQDVRVLFGAFSEREAELTAVRS